MSLQRFSRLAVFCSLLSVVSILSLTGCGQKLVTVKGTVTDKQQPIPLSQTGSVLVTLVPDVPEGTPHTNKVGRPDASGNFVIEEVPPGKYKVAVEVNDPLPGDDKLMGKFSVKSTPIRREVVDEKTVLTIDLASP